MNIFFDDRHHLLNKKHMAHTCEKLEKLKRPLPLLEDPAAKTKVTAEKEGEKYKLHVHISFPGGQLDATTVDESLQNASDELERKLRHQIEHIKK